MCGIAGIFSYRSSAPPVDQQELVKIRDHMALRGPDGAGLWMSADKRVGLGHRRLSIIDLSSGGDQPMFTPDRGLSIVFNGEIYNYQAIRKQLEARGRIFRSTSDTEVLLYAYIEYGESMVDHLRGMYAFAIWRERDKSLFMARDPFGIKPLYYSDDGYAFRFASQVKALRTSKAISSAPNAAGHVGFFLWGFVPEPHTLYESIKCLPAGSTLTIKQDKFGQVKRFFDLPGELNAFSDAPVIDRTNVRHELREMMQDTVRHHLIADVPVGIFLSSGIDSASITALASEISKDTLNTVTLGFEEYKNSELDETPLAAKLAHGYGVKQSTTWISREQFAENIQQVFDAMDQPTIDGVNTYLVSQAAAQAGMKVALSGLGGDEFFGSYPSFKDVPRSVKNFSGISRIPGLGRGFRAVTAPLLRQFTSAKYAGLIEYGGTFESAYLLRRGLYMPWELPNILEPEMVKEGWEKLQPMAQLKQSIPERATAFNKVSALELGWYMRSQLLRDSDWASMAHSLEIRVPMVDIDLFRKLGPFSAGQQPLGKYDLANACAGDSAKMLISRRKSGFAVPIERWIRDLGLTSGTERGLRDWSKAVYAKHHPKAPTDARQRVLIFRIGSLGDTCVAIPALRKIRQLFSTAEIKILTNFPVGAGLKAAPLQSVLGDSRLVDGYFEYPIGLKGWKWGELLRSSYNLRNWRPDTFVYLMPSRTRWQQFRDIVYFKGVLGFRNVVGLSMRRDTQTHQWSEKTQLFEPEAHRLGRLISGLGKVDIGSASAWDLDLLPEETILALKRIADWPGAENYVACSVGAKWDSKNWGQDRWEEWAGALSAEIRPCGLVLLGALVESEQSQAVAAHWRGPTIDLCGQLTPRESAVILRGARCFIGHDSGPMHLAASVGTPCVAVFSAQDKPGIWFPHGGARHRVIYHKTACFGCRLETCHVYAKKCIRSITVEEVLEATKSVLTENAPPRTVGRFFDEADGIHT